MKLKEYYDKNKRYTVIIYICPACNLEKHTRKQAFKNKKYLYCHDCYQKSEERKDVSKKIVQNRRPYNGENNPNYRGQIRKICGCGKNFSVSKHREKIAKYCSNKCRGKYGDMVRSILINRNKVELNKSGKDSHRYKSLEISCRCGKIFTVQPYRLKRGGKTYCSKECSSKYTIIVSDKIEYRGIKFRSSWEVVFAKYLDDKKLTWAYEKESFETPYGFYRPDFYVEEWDSYVEVKGYFRDSNARGKFEFFKTKHPCLLADKSYFKSLGFKLVKGRWA